MSAIAIEQVPPKTSEIPNLADLLSDLIVGDCRQNSVLEQAKIEQCRAALLVTSSERVNAETALAVRQLNPRASPSPPLCQRKSQSTFERTAR